MSLRRHAEFKNLLFFLFICLSVPSVARAFDPAAEVPAGGMERISIISGSNMQERTSGTGVVVTFISETASDQESRRRGLSGRETMPGDRGMLFILDTAQQNFFWMKDMMFNIDILVFDRDRKLIDILYNLFPCETCPIFKLPETAAYALEIKAGAAGKFGIRIGDFFVAGDHR